MIGPTGCKYLDDERQTRYVKDGWNYPGDAFVQDADGYFFYQARDDDMIITAGYNVGGPEVEDALLRHPAVAECARDRRARRRARHDRQGLLRAQARLSPATRRWSRPCRTTSRRRIAPFKYPRQIEFRDTLPRTETGKLQRFKLRTP